MSWLRFGNNRRQHSLFVYWRQNLAQKFVSVLCDRSCLRHLLPFGNMIWRSFHILEVRLSVPSSNSPNPFLGSVDFQPILLLRRSFLVLLLCQFGQGSHSQNERLERLVAVVVARAVAVPIHRPAGSPAVVGMG